MHFPATGLDAVLGDYADLGVQIFFVISGYLITMLLIKEYERNGRVDLKLFYLRRALRIFPASYVYLALIAVASALGIVILHRHDLLFAFTYTVNYSLDKSWRIGHLWSLSVEEQFYLLWPFALNRLNPRRAMWAAGAVFVCGPVTRILMRTFLTGDFLPYLPIFPAVADGLAAGCLMAGFRARLLKTSWYPRLAAGPVVLGLVTLVFAINALRGSYWMEAAGVPVMMMSIAVVMEWCLRNSTSLAGRILNARPVAWVGVLSYSLYIWQQIFLNHHSKAWICRFPQNIVLAVVTACASYYLLERPLLGLRQRLAARNTREMQHATASAAS